MDVRLPAPESPAEHVPLLIATALFVIVLIWRIRPVMPLTRPQDREALKVAQEKIAVATSGAERGIALCEAGEVCSARGRRVGAEGFFRRALLESPQAATLDRAFAALEKWPRTAEAVLWRALSGAASDNVDFQKNGLTHLIKLFEKSRTKRTQAQALRNLLAKL
jgi:hypothetical protein